MKTILAFHDNSPIKPLSAEQPSPFQNITTRKKKII